eukprot:14011591-Alexandrium_andersonii.AAC.3
MPSLGEKRFGWRRIPSPEQSSRVPVQMFGASSLFGSLIAKGVGGPFAREAPVAAPGQRRAIRARCKGGRPPFGRPPTYRG